MVRLIYILSLGSFAFIFGGIQSCSSPLKLVQSEGSYITLTTSAEDSTVALLLNPYKDSVQKSMGKVLCSSEEALPKIKGEAETALGNLMSDIVLNEGQKMHKEVQLSVLNLGGIRASLPQGNIRLGDVYSLMPFDNRIVLIRLGKKEIHEMVQYIGNHLGTPFSGMALRCREGNWLGEIQGVSADASDSILVATSDFLAQGGDKMNFFLKGRIVHDRGKLLRESIVDYLISIDSKGQRLSKALDYRIQPCTTP